MYMPSTRLLDGEQFLTERLMLPLLSIKSLAPKLDNYDMLKLLQTGGRAIATDERVVARDSKRAASGCLAKPFGARC